MTMETQQIRASNPHDVWRLGLAIMNTSDRHKPDLLAALHHLGLMKAEGGIFRISLAVVGTMKGRPGLLAFFRHLQKRKPSVIDAMIAQTVYHAVHGNDREDADSMGGWSQREIDLLLAHVTFSNLDVSAPPKAA